MFRKKSADLNPRRDDLCVLKRNRTSRDLNAKNRIILRVASDALQGRDLPVGCFVFATDQVDCDFRAERCRCDLKCARIFFCTFRQCVDLRDNRTIVSSCGDEVDTFARARTRDIHRRRITRLRRCFDFAADHTEPCVSTVRRIVGIAAERDTEREGRRRTEKEDTIWSGRFGAHRR